jgi:hypothetical protein
MGTNSRLVRRLALAVSVAALGLAVSAPASLAGTDAQTVQDVIDATNALKAKTLKVSKHLHGHKVAERGGAASKAIEKLQKSLADVNGLLTQSVYGLPAGDVLDSFMTSDGLLAAASEAVRDDVRIGYVDDVYLRLAGGLLSTLARNLLTAGEAGAPDPAPQALLDALLAEKDSIDDFRAKLKDLSDRAIDKRIKAFHSATSQLRAQYFTQDLGGVPLAAASAKVDAIERPFAEAGVDARALQLERARGDLKHAARACGRYVELLQSVLTGF